MCGINSGPKPFLELVSSYPSDQETNIRTFGLYYLVFNEKLSYSSFDNVKISFPGNIFSQNETLYIQRTNEIPFFERRDTITIRSLTLQTKATDNFNVDIRFTSASGENEDNDTPDLADTLRPGKSLDGKIGKDDQTPSDYDWFVVIPDSGKEYRIQISKLSEISLYCIVSRPFTQIDTLNKGTDSVRYNTSEIPYTLFDMGKGNQIAFTGKDTLQFNLTNSSLQNHYPCGSWYRISMTNM